MHPPSPQPKTRAAERVLPCNQCQRGGLLQPWEVVLCERLCDRSVALGVLVCNGLLQRRESLGHSCELVVCADDQLGCLVRLDRVPFGLRLDEVLLQQALLNLVGNSADAIRASTGDREQPGAITIRARRDGDSVDLAVIDNGGGIEECMMVKVVEPFESTKIDGLGMGLPIVRAIAEQHHGALRLENNPVGGLTVSLRVPEWKEGRGRA